MIETQSIAVQGQGNRANQEDSFSPQDDEQKSNLFMVCDGIGGAERGEAASRMAVETIREHFQKNKNKKENADAAFIQEAVQSVEQEISQYLKQHPEAEGMGTTLTLLYFSENNAIAAHIGDSRIYHIRDGSILWQSKDHSWVNEMMDRNLLTLEQAADHPKKNVITRALQGNLDKPVKADVHTIENIRSGDYFFLCSDGILESVRDQDLEGILGSDSSTASKIKTIEDTCHEHSKDNYTAFLIEVMTHESSDMSGKIVEAKAAGRLDIILDVVKSKFEIFKKKENK